MTDFNEAFDKLLEEKKKERDQILKEAEEKKEDVLKNLKDEAKNYFGVWFRKERDILLRYKQEKLFEERLFSKRLILEERAKILSEALERVGDFLSKNEVLMPKRKVITKEGIVEEEISKDEFLQFLKEKYLPEIERFFEV